jgi:hypothetical protein
MLKDENETAQLFDDVWQRDTYSGFSRHTHGETSTPFLESFLRAVKELKSKPRRVLELGAGSCDHALRCARDGFPTTAVEFSGVAVAAARERARNHPDIQLQIVQADLFAFTAGLVQNHWAGLYANSVFHFLSSDDRRNQYRILRGAMVERGILAISFKASGDALERRGAAVERTAAGPVVKGDDGICRLFVACVDPLVDEMCSEGFTVRRVIRWSVPGYNIPDERGEFVGVLAQR